MMMINVAVKQGFTVNIKLPKQTSFFKMSQSQINSIR